MENELLVNRLKEILLSMDLPAGRLDVSELGNVRWLLRNMGIRNSGNEDYREAVRLLKASL